MKIERWDPEFHLPLLSKWMVARGGSPEVGDARMYPPTGLVVDDCAAGFLFLTNAPLFGYLDSFITNPDAPGERRYKAMKLLFEVLIEEADSAGVRLLAGVSTASLIIHLGLESGFKLYETGLTHIVRNAPCHS